MTAMLGKLARVLLGGFERALELPTDTLLSMFEGEGGDFGTIRLLHYPGHGDVDGTIKGTAAIPGGHDRIGAHTDFECFTLMHQTAPGLQLPPRRVTSRKRAGEWRSVCSCGRCMPNG